MEGVKQTAIAKSILKCCRQETNEIYICPECYLNANTRPDWFVEVCSQPHLLVWAKLKGFPYWPAKVMSTGPGAFANVRFFGEHDRAYVPLKDCFLLSEQHPNTQTGKRSSRELADCMSEVYMHIENIKTKIGKFCFSPFKTHYEPLDELNQLEQMMPGVTEYINKNFSLLTVKPSLQYKIVKTADNNLSIIKKTGELNENEEVTKPKSLTVSKYEVISKLTTNKNCEKIQTVILKRKCINGSKENEENNSSHEVASKTKLRRLSDTIDTSLDTKKEENAQKNLVIVNGIENTKESEQINNVLKAHKSKINEDTTKRILEAVVPFVELKDECHNKEEENEKLSHNEPTNVLIIKADQLKVAHKPLIIKEEKEEIFSDIEEDCHQNCDKNIILPSPKCDQMTTNCNTKKFANTKNNEAASKYRNQTKELLPEIKLQQSSMVSIPADNIKPDICEVSKNALVPVHLPLCAPSKISIVTQGQETSRQREETVFNKNISDVSPITPTSTPKKPTSESTNKIRSEEFSSPSTHVLPNLAPRPNSSLLVNDNAAFGKKVGPIYRTMAKNAQKVSLFMAFEFLLI